MSPEVPLSQKINFSEHLSLLSLPYLNHISSKNLEHINDLKENVKSQSALTLVLIAVSSCSIILCILKHIADVRKNKARTLLEQQQLEQAVNELERAADSSS